MREMRGPLFVIVLLLLWIFFLLPWMAGAQQSGISPLRDAPKPGEVWIAALTEEEVKLVREALLLAAAIIRTPEEELDSKTVEGNRVVSVTREQEAQQRKAAIRLREALALFGEVAPQ